MEMKWSPMVVLSIIFHIAIFSTILFVPTSFSTRHIQGVVYEVNLVEMPAEGDLKRQNAKTVKGETGKTLVKRETMARRIPSPKKKKNSIVIAKRTINKKKSTVEKPKISSSQLIDRAISRLETRVKSENKSHVDRAISKLKSEVRGSSGSGPPGDRVGSGISIRIYQMEVERRIKTNWSFPVALQSPKDSKDLEAIVVVKVKSNGAILKSWFEKRSASTIFDQSVLRAIERSDPLPPFPEGYRKSHDEIEINFNLKDFKNP